MNALVNVDATIDVNENDYVTYLDPTLIQSARLIYETYFAVHPDIDRPLGVAINRITHRGKIIFSGKPILLPQEYFIPFELIE
ncbi:hypothetical protein [Leptolyngbya sp. NIES-2104]|uniref:hypothetical protein n=1 Tax=Leptolyngbya sp. NIES-2104 TaxID=1552121 RepID=UPI0006ECC261|nr:hypothetical protein [Leptolyngbya sp. NIES-2104]GAP98900.1 hypothetical protein NIES2104_54560 [Leptolyngbya sp. NIES-2104]